MILIDPRLSIPFFRQTTPGYCHPACVKMVIDYAITELRVEQKRLRISKIAEELGAHYLAGTPPGGIERVNLLLAESIPNIQFKSQLSGSFDEIKKEIDEGRPVIAWIEIVGKDGDTIRHAVVVNGYDPEKKEIYYVDPEMTPENHERIAEIGDFIDNKLGVRGHLVKLLISTIGQKDLMGRIIPLKKRRSRK
jgi:hypothetical protein